MYSLGLYLHIPFCKSKCPYCDFYSITDSELMRRYAYALSLHIEDYAEAAADHEIDTIFIGGGTPTALPCERLLDLIDDIKRNFTLAPSPEITLEANPATVSVSDLKRLRKAGVNRLSMGLQSANDNELKQLGRLHSFEDFACSFRAARKAGFNNINVDIMYGIPEQTKESFRCTLEAVAQLSPEHVSVYGLKIEDGTPYAERKEALLLPAEDDECDMYFEAIEFLASKGYKQYEISNFSKSGMQCQHNLRYWNCEEYIGLGPGAHSYFGGRRFAFKRDILEYIKNIENPSDTCNILSENYEIKKSERMGEYVMLRMRLTEGVNAKAFAASFGISFERLFGKYLPLYIKEGFMEYVDGFYRFTPKGMYVSNYILSAILDFDSEIISGIADGSDK